MNAPERHRSYQLDEGQARMTYEPDQRVASAGTCVEINQCVGCPRHPGSVERRGTGIATPSSKRRVDGVNAP